jgi:hypothetical protein
VWGRWKEGWPSSPPGVRVLGRWLLREMPSNFGRQTTALEVLQGADLTGKLAVVTGGNSGIVSLQGLSADQWPQLRMGV